MTQLHVENERLKKIREESQKFAEEQEAALKRQIALRQNMAEASKNLQGNVQSGPFLPIAENKRFLPVLDRDERILKQDLPLANITIPPRMQPVDPVQIRGAFITSGAAGGVGLDQAREMVAAMRASETQARQVALSNTRLGQY